MLDQPYQSLSKSIIDAELRRCLTDAISVEVLQEVESTNTRLTGDTGGLGMQSGSLAVCAAEHQTRGRGRRGKTWHTPDGGVTFSLRFTVPTPLAEVSGLSLVTGAAVCECLRAYANEPLGVKWPNDILAGNAKLVGILVEVAGHNAAGTTVVVGIGVNYRRGAEAGMIDQSSSDLFEVCGGVPPDRSVLIGELAARVYDAARGGVVEAVAALSRRWADFDAFLERDVRIQTASESVTGKSAGIDEKGRFRVKTENGLRVFSSAEVSVRQV